MFGTLRYDAQSDDTHFIERTTDPLNGKRDGQRPRYSACDKCRAKKVRIRDAVADEMVVNVASVPQVNAYPSKRSKADKSQSPKTPARGKPTEKMENLADDTMSSCLPVDKLEDDVPTSGLMQSDMLPGFNGESIDDYLDSDYFSTLPIQHDFDPEFYFASHCESLESTPTDSISDISSVFDQRSEFELSSYAPQSPLSSLQSYSDGLPSPQSTSQAYPETSSGNFQQKTNAPSSPIQETCRCLSTIVIFLEDLETKARQGMVMERLASLCESTIAKYLDGVHDGTPFRETTVDERHHSRVNLTDDVKVCIGGCEVETPDERVGLVRMMIGMQLQSLRKSIEGAATAVASRRDDKTQVLKVQAAEERLARLIGQSKS
ncbi:MAG: hypothetical protein ASARMPRED_000005 [Alectoria sarmentosa]|nr:MAG: hypothetical protein ASARMPRED_000005 [Alectoria sarmentosa]